MVLSLWASAEAVVVPSLEALGAAVALRCLALEAAEEWRCLASEVAGG